MARTAFALALVATSACGSCQPTPESDEASPEEVSAFTADLIRKTCERRVECSFRGRVFDVDTCVALDAAELSKPAGFWSTFTVLQLLAAGRLHLRRSGIAACLDDLATGNCFDVLATGLFDREACNRAIVRSRGAGEECRVSVECTAPLGCAWPASDAPSKCRSTCQQFGECLSDSDCPAGRKCHQQICDTTTLAPGSRCEVDASCTSGLCVRGICSSGEQGSPCFTSCARDLACIDGTCHPARLSGEACSFSSACASGLACLPPMPERRCIRLPAAGEPCLGYRCGAGAYCGALVQPRVCVLSARRGDDCATLRCDPGLVCDPLVKRCVDAPGAGEACDHSAGCARGLECLLSGTCARPQADYCISSCEPGQLCARDTEDGRLDIRASHCVPAPARGGACLRDESWAVTCGEAASCELDPHGNHTCHEAPGEGEACSNTCAEGFACMEAKHEDLGTCGPPPGDEGAPCDGRCAADLICQFVDGEITRRCHRPPKVEEPCRIIDGVAEACADIADLCVPLASGGAKCLRVKHLGDSCAELLECGGVLSPSVCDLASGRCVGAPRDGEPCASLREYTVCDALSAFCDRSGESPVCRSFLPENVPCTRQYDCGARAGLGYCDNATRRCMREERSPYRCPL